MRREVGQERLRGWSVVVAALALVCAAPARAQDIQCDPGDREVRALEFRGNRAFSDGELSARIVTTPSSWTRRHLRFFGTRRCLDSEELIRDKYRLQLLYLNAGYYRTAVDTVVTAAGENQVRVAFVIDEGPPVRITSVAITGLDSVPNRRDILRGLWLGVGKPYDKTRIALDIDTVLARLRNSGYPRPDVLRSFQMRQDSLTARVELTVLPGPLAHVSDIVVDATPLDGHRQEIPERVTKKLIGVGPGDVYREQALVEAQRNLYQTGAFRYVEVAPVQDSAKLYGDSAVALKVTLIEDYMRDLTTEVGWATLDCFRTRMQVVDKNFFGGAQRLELTGQASKIGFGKPTHSQWIEDALCGPLKQDQFSTQVNYSLNATLRQPTLLGTCATPAFSVYTERRGEYKAYLRTTYFGGDASLLKAFGRNTSFRVVYNFEYGKTDADPALLCAAFSRCDEASIDQTRTSLPLAILSGAIARYRTDNPLNPTSGYIWRAESRNSLTQFGSSSQLTFAKGIGDAAFYHPLGFGSVVALRLRVGAIGGGGSANGKTKQPPQQERLYAGGATSVRGFQQNELGSLLYVLEEQDVDTIRVPVPGDPDGAMYFTYPDNTTRFRRVVPVGGNTLFVANVDYRLRSPFLSNLLQYTLFVDVGSVWNRNTQETFGGFIPRWTPGVGVRVFSPVGPIQANVGYNPYPLVKSPALFTPPPGAWAAEGFTGVYCAVPSSTPVTEAKLSTLQQDQNGKRVWTQASGPCPDTFAPPPRDTFWRRLTFTFSIGTEF